MQKIGILIDKLMADKRLMFVFFCLIGVCLSCYFQYEIISDFENYHYYLPWAFVHDKTFSFIALAAENSYHNPLADLPTYFIVEHFNDHPIVLSAYNGFFYGILMFVFYQLCRLITSRSIHLFFIMLLAMTGFAAMAQIGTSSNEITVSIGVIFGLYLIYREVFVRRSERLYIFFCAGFSLGAMLGLKLTVIIYCLALGLTLILFYKKWQKPLHVIITFALGGLAGFCAVYAWWGIILWHNMENPMFPYLNNIFKSPYYADKFLTYSDFYEKKWWEYLVFPYIASFQRNIQVVSEAYMLDARMAAGYTLLLAAVVWMIVKKNVREVCTKHQNLVFLAVFAVLSYIGWMEIFSIIRYAIAFEVLISLFLVLFFFKIKPQGLYKFVVWASMGLIALFVLLSGLPYKSWGSRRHFTQIVSIEPLNLPKKSLLLCLSPGIGVAAAKIAEAHPDVLIANEVSTFTLPDTEMYNKIKQYQKNSQFTAYLLALKTSVNAFDYHMPISLIKRNNNPMVFSNLQYIIRTELGVKDFYCRNINKTPINSKIFLCTQKKYKDLLFKK